MGWGLLIIWGIIAIILGFVLISMSLIQEEELTVKGGGVIMIGPIPIAFGSDTRYLVIALVLAIILMLLALMFIFICP